jgi:L,D-transpeptidase YcbB
MAKSNFRSDEPLNRRSFLRRLGQGAEAAAATTPWLRARGRRYDAAGADRPEPARRFRRGFDSASRTIHMPQASLPTLAPSTVQTTEQAIQRYEAIVAGGGWPAVPQSDRLRLGKRHANGIPLRQRLSVAGDLENNAGVTEIFDSYVEAAVRRFQARHGIGVDGVVREQTVKALNIPAPVRLAQLRTNLVRLRRPER